jgi:hypothetical protein
MISIDEKWILGEIVGHFDGGASWTADREALILDTESGSVLLSVDSNGQGRYMVRFGDAGRGDLPGLDIELGDASTLIEAREMLDERLPEGLAQLVTNLEEDVAERKGLANALAPFSGEQTLLMADHFERVAASSAAALREFRDTILAFAQRECCGRLEVANPTDEAPDA